MKVVWCDVAVEAKMCFCLRLFCGHTSRSLDRVQILRQFDFAQVPERVLQAYSRARTAFTRMSVFAKESFVVFVS